MALDYEKLGLKIGFEIHQELDTHKLFCNCPAILREEEPPVKIRRRLRPTQSELGEVDRAALAEVTKGKEFNYHVYPDTICLVETDEEPPHPLNEEALDIALEIALLLNAKPVDEAHVMRKVVIDGSNTCGFQRTILIATDGYIEVDGKKVRIPTICLEEDAARKVREDASFVDYRLDRLGIPLVEIATGPEFSDPHTPAKAALHIGQILRATGKVKRGMGTIRQDINISVSGGARQEIKGVQELALISKVIENEVQRQIALLEIRDELRRRGASTVKKKFIDVTNVFSHTKSRVIQKAIERGGVVLAVKLSKFAGLVGKELQPGRKFGTELADHAKMYGRVEGIFHTDELPAYGISNEELVRLREATEALSIDAVIFVADLRDRAEAALSAVIDRANQALIGVPEETRRALPDGTTEFMRPLPGAGRMYPETDIAPILITEDRIKAIKSSLPELPESKKKRFIVEYRLSESLAERIVLSENVDLFEALVKKYKVEPTLVAFTLEETIVNLRREGVQTANITPSALEEIFERISKRALAKEAIPDVLRLVANGISVSSAIRQLGLERMSKAELIALISEVVQSNLDLVKERGEAAIKPLMGIIMSKMRGKADGKLVYELLERELRRISQGRTR